MEKTIKLSNHPAAIRNSQCGAPCGPGSPFQFLSLLFMVKKDGSVAAAVLFDRKLAGFPLRSLARNFTLRIAELQ